MSALGIGTLPAAAQAKFDPYLLGALLNQFAHYDDRADGGTAPLVSVGVTLEFANAPAAAAAQQSLTQWLTAHPRSRVTEAHLRPLTQGARTAYVTADVTPALLVLLGHAPFVTEVQLCADPAPRRPLAPRPVTPASPVAAPLRSSSKRILATIDHGCAFAHQALQDPQHGCRVWALWDQDPRPGFDPAQGSTPAGYGYGRQLGRTHLNACMAAALGPGGVNEDRCYQAAGYDAMRSRVTHGTWVMGLLGGARTPSSLTDSGRSERCTDATDADLVFVQVPRSITVAPGLGSIDRTVLDGLRYIADCAPDEAEITVVVDYGTDMGPHDGSSWFERALDALTQELLAQRQIRLDVFYAAGNAQDARRHAVFWADAAEPQAATTLPWWLPASNAAPVAMELWFSEATPACRLDLHPPGAAMALTIDLAQDWLGAPPGLLPAQCAVVSKRMLAPGGGWQRQLLIDVGPTQAPDAAGDAPAAPAGVWRLTLTPTGSAPIKPVHAYTCWGGQNPGMPQRAQPTRFLAPPEDGKPPTGPLRVTGDGSILGSACGGSNQLWMVGGYQRWGQYLRASYSSGGAPRGGRRAVPAGVPPHVGADWLAPTEQSPALPGLLLLGTRSAGHVRGRGTSFAAPQAARKWLAGTLATNAPPANPQPGPDSVRLPRREYGERRIV